jgi:hypothetical protein
MRYECWVSKEFLGVVDDLDLLIRLICCRWAVDPEVTSRMGSW